MKNVIKKRIEDLEALKKRTTDSIQLIEIDASIKELNTCLDESRRKKFCDKFDI